jgi:glutamate dehydrogenase
VHLRIARTGDPVPISDLLPVLENFGLRVIAERPYELKWPAGTAWLQDFELEPRGVPIDLAQAAARFQEALAGIWRREIENDGFNRLLLAAGLPARQILILRAYGRYLLQTGVPFSQGSIEQTLAANAPVAGTLVQLFERRFDPAQTGRGDAEGASLAQEIRERLQQVASLDEDRILRAYLALIEATVRTNHYQTDAAGKPHPYLSFKLDSARVPDLPLPRPKVEIFVHSPHVEGVHLRMGEVARGGIRWSDRPYDFRTEILGLMKAQNVKNTLIVPVGAKGGFLPRRLAGLAKQDAQNEVVSCYQTFIRGLLDLTDNLVAGRIVPPAGVLRHDGDDPYLVVAADKGTASFSDIANAAAAEYGYWLGDAFASGGSAGYDHKKMGITARGAWECVKRHFREAGVDIQTTDFTVAGIGDMSGDVFGNGMLLSRHIRLQAAFDHRHIFLDPSPDPAVSFAERARLAAKAQSSWADYDRQKISRGGGVFLRSAKAIELSREARALLSIDSPTATPLEVLRAILMLPVDLLWNGGIGTYVKASHEASAAVGDKANDALRINGRELRAKVVGEGGNLGFSQAGRIEYAQGGGRINTDFLDNSAGVNTSDIEVNIKILLNPQVAQGKLRLKERDRLLARMTDDVAALVLRNNYLQSQALSTMELEAGNLPQWQGLIRTLEREVQLDRAIEYLPDDETLAERAARASGLTRPELAVLLAYSKIWLNRRLLTSNLPEDVYFAHELERYFPAPLRKRFPESLGAHPLSREIIATATTNSLVHRMGAAFMPRAQEETGSEPARIARAYTAAREILDMRALWERVEALDNKVPARLQYEIALKTREVLRHVSYWLLARGRRALEVRATVDELRPGVQQLEETVGDLLVGAEQERFERTRAQLTQGGLPAALAARVACLPAYAAAPDLVEVAAHHKVAVTEVARVYFEVSAQAGLTWLGQEVERLPAAGAWQGIARQGLTDALMRTARKLAQAVLARKNGGHSAKERVAAWLAASDEWPHWQAMLAQMRAAPGGKPDFATLSVGIETVRRLGPQERNGG